PILLHAGDPRDRDALRAAAARYIAGDAAAAAELRAAGAGGIGEVRDLFSGDQKRAAFESLVASIVRDEIARAVRDEPGLIYHGQFAHLEPLGAEGVKALLQAFKDEDAPRDHRSRAAVALGDMGDASIIGELAAITKDMLTERWVELEAGYLMARLGDRSYVDPYIRAQQQIAAATPAPGNLSEIVFALTELAEVYYRIGDYAMAIFNYEKKRVILVDAIERMPAELREPRSAELALLHYNLACSLSLAGRIDEAFRALDAALGHPDVTLEMVRRDGDLRALRAAGKFAAWHSEKEKSLPPAAPAPPPKSIVPR
ncbi:MAG: tetratricopeptide repeat protein, partial [Planctomycetes bacterium]|nr:tetratricopeptide repeat protein [Planctomycetota bacterium]